MSIVLGLFLVIALSAYVLFGGADFGAGILEGTLGDKQLQKKLQATMAPVWEANHVWLIAVVVILFVGFPRFYALAMTRLYIPMSFALLFILVRGTFFTLRKYDPQPARATGLYGFLFRYSSIFTPIWFGLIVSGLLSEHPGSPKGAPDATYTAIYVAPWFNALGFACGTFICCLFGYLAAVFFFGELHEQHHKRILRSRIHLFFFLTLLSGGCVLVLGALTNTVELSEALHPGQIAAQGVAMVGTLVLFFGLRHQRRWLIRGAAGAQVLAILAGWFLVQYPTLLRFETNPLTLQASSAPFVTQMWLVIGMVVVLAVVVPLLVTLYRVFDRASESPEKDADPVR